jgi:hypothetical protein
MAFMDREIIIKILNKYTIFMTNFQFEKLSITGKILPEIKHFSTEFTKVQAELVSRFEFTKGSQSLIKTELKVNGDYTVTSLDDHVVEYWAYDEYQETETYIEPMFILIFSDGSKVDVGVYYEDVNEWGFVELQQVINFILKAL